MQTDSQPQPEKLETLVTDLRKADDPLDPDFGIEGGGGPVDDGGEVHTGTPPPP